MNLSLSECFRAASKVLIFNSSATRVCLARPKKFSEILERSDWPSANG